MPFGFILITFLILMIIFFSKDNMHLKYINKSFFIIILLFLLCGYFISAVTVGDIFSINVIFSFLIIVSSIELLRHINLKYFFITSLLLVVILTSYYLIVLYDTDYLIFINYLPIFLVITALSVLFVKNFYAGAGFILLGYFMIEFINLIIMFRYVEFVNIFTPTTMDYIMYSLYIYFVLYYIVNKLSVIFEKNLTKAKK